jgi:hypothetical protein
MARPQRRDDKFADGAAGADDDDLHAKSPK